MGKGVIKVADRDGVYLIKMLGDVRLTLSLAFDEFIEEMFASIDFQSVVFDLNDAEAIDSTTLGLMAKISLHGRSLGYTDPIVFCENTNILKLLDSMGFDDLLDITNSSNLKLSTFRELSESNNDEHENQIRMKVLQAHRALINLNANNESNFRSLINSLENLD